MTKDEAKAILLNNETLLEILAQLPNLVEYSPGTRSRRQEVQDLFLTHLDRPRNNRIIRMITAALEYHGAKPIKYQGAYYYKNIRVKGPKPQD